MVEEGAELESLALSRWVLKTDILRGGIAGAMPRVP